MVDALLCWTDKSLKGIKRVEGNWRKLDKHWQFLRGISEKNKKTGIIQNQEKWIE